MQEEKQALAHCAYCGVEGKTKIKDIEFHSTDHGKRIKIHVYCNHCHKIDIPSVMEEPLLLFLTLFG
jgi:hypothetical protein